jgi:hypothetical protein
MVITYILADGNQRSTMRQNCHQAEALVLLSVEQSYSF